MPICKARPRTYDKDYLQSGGGGTDGSEVSSTLAYDDDTELKLGLAPGRSSGNVKVMTVGCAGRGIGAGRALREERGARSMERSTACEGDPGADSGGGVAVSILTIRPGISYIPSKLVRLSSGPAKLS